MRTVSFWSFLIMLCLTLAGCGGGGGASPVQPVAVAANTGQLIIALTDAEGDFASYTVDVTAITLEREDGTVVETLPLTTRVDFAELTEVTEFLSIATVPAGRYRTATLGLDFRNADVIVQDDAGSLQQAALFDEGGAPLETLQVRLELTDADSIVIRPGVPAAFSLDFDLDASNRIDLTAAPPAVTVLPFLLASAELEARRTHRVRGQLVSADDRGQTVTLDVRPFRHRRGNFGQLTFQVSADTIYEIDGVGYSGQDGLEAMAALPAGEPVVASGGAGGGSLLADTVLAGTSVPWTEHDVAGGVVIARAADALTLSGVLVEYADGVVARRAELTVLLGEDTVVSALGLDNATLNGNSISVGQRVLAFGELTDEVTLDASGDHVRMLVSDLTAVVVEASPLVLDLHHLNARRVPVYDFTGTGVDPGNDADPESYQVDTATLSLDAVEAGDLVRVRGHVNGFGMAPEDFLALTVIDLSLSGRAASFIAGWPEPDPEAVTSITTESITLDLTNARSVLRIRGVPLAGANPLESMTLAAPEDDRGVYALQLRGSERIRVFRSFAEFAGEIMAGLDTGNTVHVAGAHGRYNAGTEELVTTSAAFELIEPGV